MRARLFRNGGSQAVRLPAEFRFEGTEVEIRQDPETGAVMLLPVRPSARSWLQERDQLIAQDRVLAELDTVLDDLRDPSTPLVRPWP